ncbi:unnamed protein product [Oikopleura dioica]|uniref:Uncharacterized protein n=1 Tax=Oikopleura dioica TaxID=34765 RepID=E4XJS9_OIKDI|nr:unnamed protein product [Oikopleura dioica]CBY39554.1 unnamed protein product [Oikopleura dioica]
MKIFQFYAASAFAQDVDNSNWSCDFSYDADNLTSPPSDHARFISTAVVDVKESSINSYISTEVMASVCEGTIITMRSEAGRFDVPKWFWSEQQEDGNYSVRYCCEPATYKNPVDELNRIFALGGQGSDNEQFNILQDKMVRDYRKKKNNGDAQTNAVEFPFNEYEDGCDQTLEFARVLKNWSSVHNINTTTGNRRRHAKFIREIDETFSFFVEYFC